jgi:hypothetical protein
LIPHYSDQRLRANRFTAHAVVTDAELREAHMIKIDWIEIPGGESLLGLSAEQKELIRRSVYRHYGVDALNARDRQMIETVKEKLRLNAVSKTEEQHYRDLMQGIRLQLSEEEERISNQFTHIFQIEAELRRIEQKVTNLETFYIARFPITQDQWAEEYGWQPPRNPMLPAAHNWYLADKFCHEVGGRLPSELEWEKAARGVEGLLYPWGNQWDVNRGNFGQHDHQIVSGTRLSPVDMFPDGASPYGVWDMCGNAYEWTMTIHTTSYDKQEEYVVKKAYPSKLYSEFAWYEHILFHRSTDKRDNDFYTGFRPVMDQWMRKVWPSLGIKSPTNRDQNP